MGVFASAATSFCVGVCVSDQFVDPRSESIMKYAAIVGLLCSENVM